MIRRPPRSTRTDTRFPYTTLFRSHMRSLLDSGFEKAMDIRIADVAVPPLPHARPARGEIQLASADASLTATATPVPSLPVAELEAGSRDEGAEWGIQVGAYSTEGRAQRSIALARGHLSADRKSVV